MIGASSVYLEGLSGFQWSLEVGVGVGKANLDTEEVDGSSPFGPTISVSQLQRYHLALTGTL